MILFVTFQISNINFLKYNNVASCGFIQVVEVCFTKQNKIYKQCVLILKRNEDNIKERNWDFPNDHIWALGEGRNWDFPKDCIWALGEGKFNNKMQDIARKKALL